MHQEEDERETMLQTTDILSWRAREPATPNDIPIVADLPDGNLLQWDPGISPTEWERLFPEIDAFPDGSPVWSEEGTTQEGEVPQERGEGETSQGGGEGEVPQAEGEKDFPTIDFSALGWSP